MYGYRLDYRVDGTGKKFEGNASEQIEKARFWNLGIFLTVFTAFTKSHDLLHAFADPFEQAPTCFNTRAAAFPAALRLRADR